MCGIQTDWNYGRLGQRSRPGTQYSVYCVWVSVCIGWVMKRSRQGGRFACLIKHVMEGVHEEFRLALRENKWGDGVEGESVRWPEKHQFCRNYIEDPFNKAIYPQFLKLSSLSLLKYYFGLRELVEWIADSTSRSVATIELSSIWDSTWDLSWGGSKL